MSGLNLSALAVRERAITLFLIIAIWEWGSFHGGWVERWARVRGHSGAGVAPE